MALWQNLQTGRCLCYLALCAVAAANAGCLVVAAGTAAGAGAAGYAYYRGNVEREYAASFEQTWSAAQAALADLGLPVISVTHGYGDGTVECQTADGRKVEINVEAADSPGAPLTRVGVRVGVFGDRPLSERYLDQLQSRLPAAPAGCPGTAMPPPPAETAPPPLAAPK
jgi:hypothetical protein